MKHSKYNASKLLKSLGKMVDGVAIVDPDDRSTWRIDFKPDATDEQKAAARTALESYVEKEDPPALSAEDVVSLLVKSGHVSQKDVDDLRAEKAKA